MTAWLILFRRGGGRSALLLSALLSALQIGVDVPKWWGSHAALDHRMLLNSGAYVVAPLAAAVAFAYVGTGRQQWDALERRGARSVYGVYLRRGVMAMACCVGGYLAVAGTAHFALSLGRLGGSAWDAASLAVGAMSVALAGAWGTVVGSAWTSKWSPVAAAVTAVFLGQISVLDDNHRPVFTWPTWSLERYQSVDALKYLGFTAVLLGLMGLVFVVIQVRHGHLSPAMATAMVVLVCVGGLVSRSGDAVTLRGTDASRCLSGSVTVCAYDEVPRAELIRFQRAALQVHTATGTWPTGVVAAHPVLRQEGMQTTTAGSVELGGFSFGVISGLEGSRIDVTNVALNWTQAKACEKPQEISSATVQRLLNSRDGLSATSVDRVSQELGIACLR